LVQPRAIPCLLLKGKELVKTIRFREPRYIGDPINAVRLFNDLAADELIFVDITATRERRPPDYDLIETIAGEAFMPLAYGGGIASADHAARLFTIGIEKVVITSAAAHDPALLSRLAGTFGSQSIVAGIDVRQNWLRRPKVTIRSASATVNTPVVAYAKQLEESGAGEIFLNCVDRDGTMSGYDLELIKSVSTAVNIPVVACGGAGQLSDLALAVDAGASAAAAGSLFVYAGPRRGVLINYPPAGDLEQLFARPA